MHGLCHVVHGSWATGALVLLAGYACCVLRAFQLFLSKYHMHHDLSSCYCDLSHFHTNNQTSDTSGRFSMYEYDVL